MPTLAASTSNKKHATTSKKAKNMTSTATQTQADKVSMPKDVLVDSPVTQAVEKVVRQYFLDLGDNKAHSLYDIMLPHFEKPLLTVVLEQTRGNQTKTAEILGLNRGTLRKKMKTYNLM